MSEILPWLLLAILAIILAAKIGIRDAPPMDLYGNHLDDA